jgi:hypothetical protein
MNAKITKPGKIQLPPIDTKRTAAEKKRAARVEREAQTVDIVCSNLACQAVRTVGIGYSRSQAYLESNRLCASCARRLMTSTSNPAQAKLLDDNRPAKGQKKCTGCGIIRRNAWKEKVIPPVCKTCRHHDFCIEIVATDDLRELLDHLNESPDIDASELEPFKINMSKKGKR